MEFGAKISCYLSFIMFFTLQVQILINAQQQVPCLFSFGDSLFDNGNNNRLLTLARVNYAPYGIDFRDGPTGRFTNGRTTVDFLAELLGFNDFIPPFATARGRNILKGVNYASGGGGIRQETGRRLGGRISFGQQLSNHIVTVAGIAALQRNFTFTREFLNKCIYVVGMGSNDYINNYLMPQFYLTSRKYTPDLFANVLIRQYYRQLRRLYSFGARKVAVFGLGLIGCTPAELALAGPANASGCVDSINSIVNLFNNRLPQLINGLNNNLTDAKFILINSTNIALGDPSLVGVTVVNAPCCVTNNDTGLCVPNQAPCSNRTQYIFWDAFHPTEIATRPTAQRSYTALSPLDVYPIDISRLARQ